MSVHGNGGSTAFDRLANHYDEDRTCSACGHEDRSGHWTAKADGATVEYRHTCPSCGAVETRNLTLSR